MAVTVESLVSVQLNTSYTTFDIFIQYFLEVIDLTDEKDNEDIEKAIALSLQATNSPLV